MGRGHQDTESEIAAGVDFAANRLSSAFDKMAASRGAKPSRAADYRAYVVDHDGHFRSSEVIIADDDGQAVAIAKSLVDGHDVEVWQLDRKITVLPHKD